ncbi:Bug family tripartite tricarboxylate transporter substrate binding protein [Falsiroseomonas selenitidurans]|uniref:Tripartite tricarboxylate transporter substrate binding protein n=1 Tax=Falsiroseomonas selenitidurans TaxID=2716335 RepID=A0ABX1E6Q3_9PROT|nr:tripartite tricarboxylate transporter substrate binding protein [Falsiroseomonas selenitidurans]NKC31207.1 tripartite tricarboxylate transporter substrate binding protein [Falsiroseomonas selenitidurans]
MRTFPIGRRGLGLAAAGLLATPALAQPAWPRGPVRLIFPYTPGSAVDVVARLVAQDLTERLGQPFIVESRTGAGGSIGTEIAARARPDGDTFLVGSPGNMAIGPALLRNLTYDVQRDFAAVVHMVTFPQVLVVSPSLPVHSLAELVAHSKANPGKLNYASSGIGATNHLAMEMLRAATGLNATHVPYRGGLVTLQAIMSNDVQMCIEGILTVPSFLAEGKLRAIAVTGAQRSPLMADVPAVAETVPGFDAGAWVMLFAPTGTPAPIIEKLSAEVRVSLAKPAIQARLSQLGATVTGTTAEQAAAIHRQELEKWRRAVEASGAAAG